MKTHYYLSVFPIEALIASQLELNQFGTYMATGSKRGTSEQIIFCEVDGNFEDHFDWIYAEKQCVAHSDGEPKHSVYLSVYRTLENIPLERIGKLYLTTKDGRTLSLDSSGYLEPESERGYYIYQELCPITPVIVSRFKPSDFGKYLTNPQNKVYVPKIIFADMKLYNFDDMEHTGNIGGTYDRNKSHLLNCIASVTSEKPKENKTLDRSHVESFTFQIIETAIYIADGKNLKTYPMPSIEEIKKIDYDWGRSALII